jgi:septal ring factor EnvC (AmiA/AmiB activator)
VKASLGIRAWLAVAVALLAVGGQVLAQDPEPAPAGLESKEAELAALRTRIQAHREQAAALQADEKGQLARLNELEKESALVEELLDGLNARGDEIQQETEKLEQQIAQVEARVAARRQHLAQRLRAMYMRGDRSPLLYLITSSSVDDVAARVRTITHVARAEKTLINDVLTDQRSLRGQRSELQRRMAEVHRNQSEAQDQRLALDRLQTERTQALNSVRQEPRCTSWRNPRRRWRASSRTWSRRAAPRPAVPPRSRPRREACSGRWRGRSSSPSGAPAIPSSTRWW